jgi:hypothetical protein
MPDDQTTEFRPRRIAFRNRTPDLLPQYADPLAWAVFGPDPFRDIYAQVEPDQPWAIRVREAVETYSGEPVFFGGFTATEETAHALTVRVIELRTFEKKGVCEARVVKAIFRTLKEAKAEAARLAAQGAF